MIASQKLPKNSWILLHALILVLLLVVLLGEFYFMSSASFLVDEKPNWEQIELFLNKEYRMYPSMNVIPGYHALIAFFMTLFQKSGTFSARFISTIISYASIIVFYLATWKICGKPSIIKTLQFAFFPLFLPFFPLIYTDILALFLALLGFFLVLVKHYTLAGMVSFLGILARTNNIAWFAFQYVYIYYEIYGLDWRAFPKSLRNTWIYWLGFGIFGVFIILNRGIAITAKELQPMFRFESGNVFLLLFLFFYLFLPLNIANIPAIVHIISKRRWIVLLVILTFLVYLFTFRSTHIYNQIDIDYFLRNKLLQTVTSSLIWKTIFFVPILFSILSLAVTTLRRNSYYLLYLFTILSLIPFWLIEPRYSFIPLSLFLLFKQEKSLVVEWLTIAMYIFIGILMLPAIRNGLFFI